MRIVGPAEFPILDAREVLVRGVFDIPPSLENCHDRLRLLRLVQSSLPAPCPVMHLPARLFVAGRKSSLTGFRVPPQGIAHVVVTQDDLAAVELDGPGLERLREQLQSLSARLVLLDLQPAGLPSDSRWFERDLTTLARDQLQRDLIQHEILAPELEPGLFPAADLAEHAAHVLHFLDLADAVIRHRLDQPDQGWAAALEVSLLDDWKKRLSGLERTACELLIAHLVRWAESGARELPQPSVGGSRSRTDTCLQALVSRGLLVERDGKLEMTSFLKPLVQQPSLLRAVRNELRQDDTSTLLAQALGTLLEPILRLDNETRPIQSLSDLRRRMDELKNVKGADVLARTVFRHIEGQLEKATRAQSQGQMELARGDFAEARTSFREALRYHLEVQDHHGAGADFAYLGRTSASEGDHGRAILYFENALDLHRRLKDHWGCFLDLQSQAKAFLGWSHSPLAGLAGLKLAVQEARSLAAPAGNKPARLLETLLARAADTAEGRELSTVLDKDPEGLRRQGIHALLENPGAAVAYWEDQLTVSRSFHDAVAVATTLGHQAEALTRGHHLRGAVAALLVLEQTVAGAAAAKQDELRVVLEKWTSTVREHATEAVFETTMREVQGNPEALRREAIEALLPTTRRQG